jgi:hypothetical protein
VHRSASAMEDEDDESSQSEPNVSTDECRPMEE